MKFDDKRATLSDGTIVFLKSPCADEAVQTLDFLKKVSDETDFLSHSADQRKITFEMEKEWINAHVASQNSVQIGVYKDDELIAMAGIEAQKGARKQHRAVFGISVLKAYWHMGIGHMLMKECISCAQRIGYEYIDLYVIKDNERAINLYQKFDFEIVSTVKNGMKIDTNCYFDEIMMTLPLME